MNTLFRFSALLVVSVMLISACGPVTAVPTQTPVPPTVPPTKVPPTSVPTAEPPTATPHPTADSVFKNGYIYTVDKAKTVAQAIAVKGDTIVYVGDDAGAEAWIGPDTKVTDLGGKLVLPGLVDSHAHATWGVSSVYEVQLYGIGSIDEYKQVIKEFVDARPDLQGLQGMGWINAVFGPNGPTKDILDEIIPNIPAVLTSEDGHSVWVNSKTLELAGITKDTQAPAGGVIERDAAGNPSGTLRESASDLVSGVIPGYTVEQYAEGLKYVQDMYHSYGTTMVYIPSADETSLQALHDLDAAGELAIRYPTAVVINPEDDLSAVDKLVSLREQEKGGNFWIAGAKIFMDGVLEGGTAYLEQPYVYKPDSRGELLWDPQKYNEFCAALDKAGLQIHVHAIGDAAVRITVDGFAYANEKNGPADRRPGVTHIQLVNPADIQRFADLGVTAVPQPYWFVVDTYYTQAVEYVGQERADQQYPMKSYFDAGARVASASDYPVTVPPDPMLAIELGVTRTAPEGVDAYVDPDTAKALWPAQDVTVEQMIESFTINGAYAAFMEKEIGSLEVGKKADFIVLSQNILQIAPREIHKTITLLTIFGGQEVYRSEEYK